MKKIVRTLCLIWWGIFGCVGILLFTGCSWKQEKPEKTNLAFTVVDEARLPEELLKLVAEKKEASFKWLSVPLRGLRKAGQRRLQYYSGRSVYKRGDDLSGYEPDRSEAGKGAG